MNQLLTIYLKISEKKGNIFCDILTGMLLLAPQLN